MFLEPLFIVSISEGFQGFGEMPCNEMDPVCTHSRVLIVFPRFRGYLFEVQKPGQEQNKSRAGALQGPPSRNGHVHQPPAVPDAANQGLPGMPGMPGNNPQKQAQVGPVKGLCSASRPDSGDVLQVLASTCAGDWKFRAPRSLHGLLRLWLAQSWCGSEERLRCLSNSPRSAKTHQLGSEGPEDPCPHKRQMCHHARHMPESRNPHTTQTIYTPATAFLILILVLTARARARGTFLDCKWDLLNTNCPLSIHV